MALGRSTSLVADAGAAGSLFGSAVMNTLGFEDEEAAVNRILKNADFNTAEGMEKLKSDVRAISMDAYEELMLQLNTTAQAEAQTQNTKLATENSIIQNKVKLNRGIYSREFERDASSSGMEFAIREYFSNEGLEYDENNPPKTIAQASTLIAKLRKKEKDGRTYITGVKNAVGTALENYVNMRAIQDSGLQGSSNESKVAATTNAFDEPINDKSTVVASPEREEFVPKDASYLQEWSGGNDELAAYINRLDAATSDVLKRYKEEKTFMNVGNLVKSESDRIAHVNDTEFLEWALQAGDSMNLKSGAGEHFLKDGKVDYNLLAQYESNPFEYWSRNIKTNSSSEEGDYRDIFDF